MKFTGERMIPEANKGNVIYGEHLVRYIFSSQLVKNKIVLDIACGTGYGSKYLTDRGAKRVYGVDISEESIDYAKKKFGHNDIEYIVGNGEKIPLKDGTIDTVVSMETIEHVKQYKNFLIEIKRVLKDGGVFVVSTPNKDVYEKQRANLGKNPFHFKEFSQDEFEKFLKENFKFVSLYSQFDWTSSLILDEATAKKSDKNSKLEINTIKEVSAKPKDSIYLLGICSDKKLPNNIAPNCLIFEDLEFKNFRNHLMLLEDKQERLEIQVNKFGSELSSIYDSKAWRLISFLRNIKQAFYGNIFKSKIF